METITYKEISETYASDWYRLPYKIKFGGTIFTKELGGYYAGNHELSEIIRYLDDECEIIEWFEPEITKEELLQQRIDKAIEYIEKNSYVYTFISKELKEKEIDDLLSILRGEDNE